MHENVYVCFTCMLHVSFQDSASGTAITISTNLLPSSTPPSTQVFDLRSHDHFDRKLVLYIVNRPFSLVSLTF